MFFTVNLALLVAQIGSGFGAHLGGGPAALRHGPRRCHSPPLLRRRSIPARTIPRNNILLVGGLALAGALRGRFRPGIELLNFGALIGFMGVNLAAFVRYFVRGDRKTFLNLAPPLVGFACCLYLWCSLNLVAKAVGLAWLAFGLLYGAWKTGGFRRQIEFAVPDEETITASP